MKQTALLRLLAQFTTCRVLKNISEAILKRGFWVLSLLLFYCGVCQLKGLAFLGMYQKGLPKSTVNHLIRGVPDVFISVFMMISLCTSLLLN